MKKPNIQIYKYMIFDFNRSDGNDRPREIGMIIDEEPYFYVDDDYDRIEIMFQVWDKLWAAGIGFCDAYFGEFMDWALDFETKEHHAKFLKKYPLN